MSAIFCLKINLNGFRGGNHFDSDLELGGRWGLKKCVRM